MAIVTPEYCTGRQLWRLGMPASLRPDDPGFVPGLVSAIVRTGAGPGVISIHSGGPTDSYSVRIEVMGSGALGVATMRYRLQDAEAWSVTTLIPADEQSLGYSTWVLPESGLVLRFSGSFTATDVYTFVTVESPQAADLRRAISGEMARKLRVRGALPLTEWGVDISLIAARLVAYELLAIRGYDPQSKHDQLVSARAEWARNKLTGIAEEMEQSDLPGQSAVLGVACSSQPPQGVDLW